RRQAGALRLHRVLDRLDEDRLAALDQILDLARALAALELGADDLVDVEEAVLLEADLDERGLHPRQDVVDDAEVDVAGDRAVLRPLEVDLGDPVVLEHGDAFLARVDRDEELALRLRERRALRRLALRRPRALARPALGSRLRLRLDRGGGRRGGALAAAAAPRAATTFLLAARLSVGGLAFGRIGDGCRFRFECRSGRRLRRLLPLPFPSSEPGQWQTCSPSDCVRAA